MYNMETLVIKHSDNKDTSVELTEKEPLQVVYGKYSRDTLYLAVSATRCFNYLVPSSDKRELLTVRLLPAPFVRFTCYDDTYVILTREPLVVLDKHLTILKTYDKPEIELSGLIDMGYFKDELVLLYFSGVVALFHPESNKETKRLEGDFTSMFATKTELYLGTRTSYLIEFDEAIKRKALVQLNIGEITSISICCDTVCCTSYGGKSIQLDRDLMILQRKSSCFFQQFEGAYQQVQYPSIVSGSQLHQEPMSFNAALVESASEDRNGCLFALNNMSVVMSENEGVPYIVCSIDDGEIDIRPREVAKYTHTLGIERLHACLADNQVVYCWKEYIFAQEVPRRHENLNLKQIYSKKSKEEPTSQNSKRERKISDGDESK